MRTICSRVTRVGCSSPANSQRSSSSRPPPSGWWLILLVSAVSFPCVSVSSVLVDRLVVYLFCALLVLIGPDRSFCDLRLLAMGGGVGIDLGTAVDLSGYVGVRNELACVANHPFVSICLVVTFVQALGVWCGSAWRSSDDAMVTSL